MQQLPLTRQQAIRGAIKLSRMLKETKTKKEADRLTSYTRLVSQSLCRHKSTYFLKSIYEEIRNKLKELKC